MFEKRSTLAGVVRSKPGSVWTTLSDRGAHSRVEECVWKRTLTRFKLGAIYDVARAQAQADTGSQMARSE